MATTPQLPTLPMHLQKKILNHLSTPSKYLPPEDLVFLWTTVRNVSTTFRAIVDDIARSQYLPNIEIHYEFERNHEHHGRIFFLVECPYKDVSKTEANIAIFSIQTSSGSPKMARKVLKEETERYNKGGIFEPSLLGIHRPPHSVIIQGTANDTELPDFSIDYEKLELSFNWKAMLTAFCYEEKLFATKMLEWVQSLKARNLKKRFGSTEPLDTSDFLEHIFPIRKETRRRRVMRQYFRVKLDTEFHTDRGDYDDEEFNDRYECECYHPDEDRIIQSLIHGGDCAWPFGKELDRKMRGILSQASQK